MSLGYGQGFMLPFLRNELIAQTVAMKKLLFMLLAFALLNCGNSTIFRLSKQPQMK
jgi:hypothetical protein